MTPGLEVELGVGGFPLQTSIIESDRWNVLVPTPWMARHPLSHYLDGPSVALEGAWRSGRPLHAWATMNSYDRPPWFEEHHPAKDQTAFEVWGPSSSRKRYHPTVHFSALYYDTHMPLPVPQIEGPKGLPYPANALFLALDKIVEECGGRHVRIFGAHWGQGENRWQSWTLERCMRVAAANGVTLERVPAIADHHVDNPKAGRVVPKTPPTRKWHPSPG